MARKWRSKKKKWLQSNLLVTWQFLLLILLFAKTRKKIRNLKIRDKTRDGYIKI